jgi:hypothetical protein
MDWGTCSHATARVAHALFLRIEPNNNNNLLLGNQKYVVYNIKIKDKILDLKKIQANMLYII